MFKLISPVFVLESPAGHPIYLRELVIGMNPLIGTTSQVGIHFVPNGQRNLWFSFPVGKLQNHNAFTDKITLAMHLIVKDWTSPATILHKLHVLPYFGFEASADELAEYMKRPWDVIPVGSIKDRTKAELVNNKFTILKTLKESDYGDGAINGQIQVVEHNWPLPFKDYDHLKNLPFIA